jgi:hypothetical protein
MNKLIADIFSGLVGFLHLIVIIIIALLFFFLFSETSSHLSLDEKFVMAGYAIASLVAYIILMGLISVVLAIHENINAIRETLERNNK